MSYAWSNDGNKIAYIMENNIKTKPDHFRFLITNLTDYTYIIKRKINVKVADIAYYIKWAGLNDNYILC